MARIKINVAALRTCQSQINNKINELQGLNSRLEGQIGTIADSWEGDASRAYEQMMRSYLSKAKRLPS